MIRKNNRNTKGRIVSAAWKLFYDKGYDATTVEDIVWESGTSKGSFYHYFESKDALLSSLSYLFDNKYMELEPELANKSSVLGSLLFLNEQLFGMIEDSVDISLLSRLFSTQLTIKGEQSLLDRDRFYYKLIKKLVLSGQEAGEITTAMTAKEIVKYYAICERALMYDWCLCKGDYSLREYGKRTMPMFLEKLKA
ncbi:MAG: TetR/AcrR family transcriptional regulator [Ruminococcaceae bacterium]|nr:TetR/AcrR family transcriptional regulator [Oscillospiraceae bacterium]